MKVEDYRTFAENTVKHYRTDLQYDIDYMLTGKPCLLFLRETGSHMVTFDPAEDYPAAGEKVKYLFGYADRHDMLREKKEVVEHCLKPNSDTEIILFFNGRNIKKITAKSARNIIDSYTRLINAAFNK